MMQRLQILQLPTLCKCGTEILFQVTLLIPSNKKFQIVSLIYLKREYELCNELRYVKLPLIWLYILNSSSLAPIAPPIHRVQMVWENNVVNREFTILDLRKGNIFTGNIKARQNFA